MKTKISAFQLFSAIVMVPYGTAVIYFMTPKAKQDAWISMLIYILAGIILQLIYVELWKKYPKDTIVTYMPKIFGKVIGYTLSVIYIIYFAYEAARATRDISELILIAVMPRMSMYIIGILFMSTVIYGTYTGIENLSRVCCIFLILFVFLFVMKWIFLLSTPDALKFYNLKPVLEKGILPVIKEGWPLITFPYGESIVLAMLYPSVTESSRVRKAAVLATIILGILLTVNAIMFISVLGLNFATTSLFPFLQIFRIMKIGEAFNRLGILAILYMLIGGFIKVSFFMYGSMLGISQLIKLDNTKNLALPLGIAVFITSLLIASDYPQHIYIGQETLKYILLPLAVIIPAIALIVYYLKALLKKIMKYI
ncbi:spore germination protein [Clostridium algoriphilum]|uniref:GerAB/ArcD/ProY family transporter n=1 Tax=Clostridium algoriphilum TaxID=198347 RepID=UPI001CF2418A|nr:GerAB/ArcD/ProY family transporter [Clostridium algoriphilum]MCB2292775.1 spore germination protein [Clostridium algoriphilum]